MARRISSSQLRSQIRQAQQKRRQAINKYNSAVRKYNGDSKRAVDNYNREVRAHNSRVRLNRQRLKRELAQLESRSRSKRQITYRSSVATFRQSLSRLEQTAQAAGWGDSDLFDQSEGEVANSVAVLGALLDTADQEDGAEVASLQHTTIANELQEMGGDLDARWKGALFALNPSNPDAARHFCISSREILTQILDTEAPDQEVIAAIPAYEKTPDGGVSRRARVRYCLERRGIASTELEDFVEEDLNNVVALFQEVNKGAHGNAGRFSMKQLLAIKRRVEDAIRFLHDLVR